jgi:hypothetical protein
MGGAALPCSLSLTDIHALADKCSAGATPGTQNTEFAELTAMVSTIAEFRHLLSAWSTSQVITTENSIQHLLSNRGRSRTAASDPVFG